jgi:hypothetical protein
MIEAQPPNYRTFLQLSSFLFSLPILHHAALYILLPINLPIMPSGHQKLSMEKGTAERSAG